ncbi:hypothetical protein [Streptococcus salivarius]|uniref:Glucosyltransferase (Side chain biosynthesis) n=1 Tax=Streptococcus salivarius K12 TaxID=1200793 RepID=J7TMV3_STRSL|nr:hypothetical protein [Streptococcus salivarius]EJO15444.1 Glucosyltransferase (side chain biosynthesis) [Streptococcus salivarius K12]MBZ5836919.1 hypothetical protein [Streptococcus salivarius]
MKKKYSLWLYYIFISFLFTLESVVYIGDPGDQFEFAKMANKFSFFGFAIFRYKTWSSRLLIESITMFLSAHYLIFKFCLFAGMIIFFYVLNELLINNTKDYRIKFITPILFLISFPSVFFTSAGLIATMTNYLFPMISFVVGCYLLKHSSKWFIVSSVPFLIFSCMQEQFTVFAFLLAIYILFKNFIINKEEMSLNVIPLVVCSILGLVSAVLAPGSKIRVILETKTWYPGFDKLSIYTKVAKGFLETNRVLFLSTELSVIFLILLLFIFVSLTKKLWTVTFISSGFLYILLTNKLGVSSILSALSRLIEIQNSRNNMIYFNWFENLFPLILYTSILVVLAYITFKSFSDFAKGMDALVILAIGYISRMTVSLSPTLYASQLRTFTPLVFSLLILSILLIKEGIDNLSINKNREFLVK